ncbi:S-adenosyl-L-methionine-dependent methyltransferase [Xylariales sp. PMI_506]|nr:S-adenosyl-L-methionine-dependent methyltransferase [Xylariales sp. PMI_506]
MASPNAPFDPTFRNYRSQQAASYAAHRRGYKPTLIQEVIDYHESHGGHSGTVLDVGCGTGQAVRHLAAHFSRAVGVDPGEEMIAQATQTGGKAREFDILYEVLEAEQLQKSGHITVGSVDLLTSAMAAHWFRMKEFWAQAAWAVKPGGTVALWTKSSLYCHPSTPNAAAVQQALSHLEDGILGPYELPQNRLSRNMYDDLVMPWFDQPTPEFPESSFVRREWNRDGKLEPGETDFFGGSSEISLQQLAESLQTASMVTRWREANPELTGTDQDCVTVGIRAVASAMGLGEGDFDQGRIKVGSSTVLLLFKRETALNEHL